MRRFRKGLIRIIAILLVAFVAVMIWFRGRYHHPIRNLVQTQVINSTSDLINDAIDEQIETGNIQYMSEVNRLKTDILNIINDEILSLDTEDLGIPLGSLLLPEFLSGKGPKIPVRILTIRNSDADFQSNFSEAGINQTLQQLTMRVSVDVTILVLGETESITVSSQVVVAETIIVGQVPDTFLQTGG